jgi:predicted methyltransferase
MRSAIIITFLAAATWVGAIAGPGIAQAKNSQLEKAVASAERTPAMVARDPIRHPVQELEFLGIKPTMTVVEIWPESGYWTEILAPYLRDRGHYIAAGVPRSVSPGFAKAVDAFQAKLDANKARYGDVKVTDLYKGFYDIAPPGSADRVLTFRNLHNWMAGGWADDAFAAFYKALKPGGILGVEEHRGRDDQPQDPLAKSGYVRQDYTIAMARKAGFELVGSSELNANPKDTKDYPEGVWTLPPTYTLGDKDRAKYEAIGEADNFVLKFRKPLK